MHTDIYKINKLFSLLISIIFLQACTTSQVLYEHDTASASAENKATIIINRELQFMGGGADMYVLDELSDTPPDSLLGSLKASRNEGGKHTGMSLYLYYNDKSSNAKIITENSHSNFIGSPTLQDVIVNHGLDYNIIRNDYSLFKDEITRHKAANYVVDVLSIRGVGQAVIDLWSATTIGTVGNGGSITWKRPPGNARITVVLRSFIVESKTIKEFTVEAGKTYVLDLHYKTRSGTAGSPELKLLKTY